VPYIKPEDRTQYMLDAIDNIVDEITSKGDFNFVICEILGQLILNGKIGYTEISNWIDTLPDAEDEARRQLLHPYEDIKKEENGNVPSWATILEKIKK